MPAAAFARVSIARDIIRGRRSLGLSQQALAGLAGVRQETISRIETARHAPTAATIDNIQRSLRKAARPRRGVSSGRP